MTVSCLDSPQVSPDFVEQMAEQYGEESNIYRVRVLGLPPTADDDNVIPRHLVESAIGREVEGIETVMPIWGLDVARMGGDRSALCKRRGNVVTEHIKTWRDKDLMELCGIVLTEYESAPYSERPSEIVIDSIGLGAGVVDRLVELDLPARGAVRRPLADRSHKNHQAPTWGAPLRVETETTSRLLRHLLSICRPQDQASAATVRLR